MDLKIDSPQKRATARALVEEAPKGTYISKGQTLAGRLGIPGQES